MEFVCHADLCDLIGDLGFSGVDREFGYCLLLRFGWRRTGNSNCKEQREREKQSSYELEERLWRRASTFWRSSSVSTPMVSKSVGSTWMGMLFSRKRSCSRRSVCSSALGGRVGKRWRMALR